MFAELGPLSLDFFGIEVEVATADRDCARLLLGERDHHRSSEAAIGSLLLACRSS